MAELGLKPTKTYKIYKFGNTGGFYLRCDSEKLWEMLERHQRELDEAIESDKTEDGFIYSMFYYELNHHGYIVTYDVDDTLNSLGITNEDLERNKALSHGLKKAYDDVLKDYYQ